MQNLRSNSKFQSIKGIWPAIVPGVRPGCPKENLQNDRFEFGQDKRNTVYLTEATSEVLGHHGVEDRVEAGVGVRHHVGDYLHRKWSKREIYSWHSYWMVTQK